jgi:CoA-transferase family III
LAGLPLVSIEKIGEAAPKPWPAGDRPLAGLRVLDLSRVIAGPVAGRTLAAHGADVLLVSGPDMPAIPWLTIDTGRGKLTSFVELKSEQGRETLRDLLAGADIFSQGYRPRALASLGFSPEEAAGINPGRGRNAAASTRWCRRRPASTMPKARPPTSRGRRNCRPRCSITPPAT